MGPSPDDGAAPVPQKFPKHRLLGSLWIGTTDKSEPVKWFLGGKLASAGGNGGKKAGQIALSGL